MNCTEKVMWIGRDCFQMHISIAQESTKGVKETKYENLFTHFFHVRKLSFKKKKKLKHKSLSGEDAMVNYSF